ncbi:hypothetical protein DFH06DRAFT_1416799 [Mycena polygramma]|nr:hypothetical protein DFH06DRAFT_1416799 [Mycena polygramma]
MPALQAPASSPVASPISSVASGGITLAGHIYTAAQVHIFLRGAGLLAGFFLFSYLALVTLPKLALRSRPRPERGTSTPTAPEHPFSTRPRALTARAYMGPTPPRGPAGNRRATITSAAKTRPPAQASQHSPPPPLYPEYHAPAPHKLHVPANARTHSGPFSPPIWAALTHLHRTADAGVTPRLCPSKVSLRAPASALGSDGQQAHLSDGSSEARRLKHVHERFPWVSPTHVFGLVRPRLAPGKTRVQPHVAKIYAVESSAGASVKPKGIEGKNGGNKSKRRRPFSLGMFNGTQKSGNANVNAAERYFKKLNSADASGKAKCAVGKENVAPLMVTSTF